LRSRFTLIAAALLGALALIGSAAPAGAAPEDPSRYVLQWGSFGDGPTESVFNTPRGISVAANGDVYVADTQNNRIQRFSATGNFELAFGGPGSGNSQFNNPRGVEVDAAGNVYVLDTGNDRIQKFNADGLYITTFGGFGSGNGQFDNPSGIGFALNGDLYVADTDNDRIQRFTSGGTFVSEFGSQGAGDLEFNDPWGVAVDSTGRVFVADTGNNRIVVLQDDSAEAPPVVPPVTALSTFGAVGTADGLFNSPRGVQVDSTDRVWVADTINHRIQVFAEDPGSPDDYLFQSRTGGNGIGNGQFDQPNDLGLITNDTLVQAYVIDTLNERVQKLGPLVDFDDVTSSNVFYDDISWIAAGGYATGYNTADPSIDPPPPPGTYYRPSSPLTRQAMSAFLFRLAGSPPGPFPDPGFDDVSVTHPFYIPISWLATTGITTGYDNNTFRPAATITRQAMAAFMFRYRASPSGSFPNPGFSDVTSGNAFYTEISWAADVGVVDGYVDNTYRPSNPVTRQAMASFLFGLSELGVPVV
jgi:sugar lactone lactonase YvrE